VTVATTSQWLIPALLGAAVTLGVFGWRLWENWRPPKVRFVVDAKTREYRVEVVNHRVRKLPIRELGLLPEGGDSVVVSPSSWMDGNPIVEQDALIASVDFDAMIRFVGGFCRERARVRVRAYVVTGTGKRHISKPMFYDVKTQRLTEKEPE
jgi:hypothetical protein